MVKMKRTQLNIEIGEDLLKSLKLFAIKKNVKLNALVKEILKEKINYGLKKEISDAQINKYEVKLNQLDERVSNIEKNQHREH
tara:strand:+ start:441 stop:689 length:249 start_codon:yes stop_codon:yes gene_type:complete